MTFREQVLDLVARIPYGRVVSYGQVAAAMGNPRASRQVGWALRTLDGREDVPWWRVINSQGYISIKGNFVSTPQLQKQLLEKEGVQVSEDFHVDFEQYRYHFSPVSKTKK